MAKLDLKDFNERIQAIFEYGIPTDFSHGSRGDDLHQRKNKKPKKDKDAWASEILARHHPNRLLKKKMSAKEATEYLGIPEGYVEETKNNTKKDNFDNEGHKKWQKDAQNVDKKEYNKWRKEAGIKEGTKLDPKKATKKEIRQADIKGEIGKKPKGHPPGPMMKMYGPFDRTKLKKKLKIKEWTDVAGHGEDPNDATPPATLSPYQKMRLARQTQKFKKMRAGEFAKAHGKQWKKGGVKEEQQRVIESLANLTSRGLDHKPIQKKKLKIDPGKAVRKATAERLQKTAKARIRATTTRQKFGEGYKALAWHYRKKEAAKREKVTKDHGKITNKITNPTPSMHHIKDTMWGKGKHSTKNPYMEAMMSREMQLKHGVGKPTSDKQYAKQVKAHKDAEKKHHGWKNIPAGVHRDMKAKNMAARKTYKPSDVSYDHKALSADSSTPKKLHITNHPIITGGNPTEHDKSPKGKRYNLIKKTAKRLQKEGTFKDQLEPEYTEGKQRIKNKIRKKLGLKPGPQFDWKKEQSNKEARRELMKRFTHKGLGLKKEAIVYPKSAIKDMNKQADKHDKTWWKDQDKAKNKNKFKFNSWRHIIKDKSKKKLKETELPPHLAKFINPKTGNLKSKYEKRMNKPQVLSSKKPKFTVKDVTPKGYGPEGYATGIPVEEDAASGRPIKKPVKKIKKKDSGKDGAFIFSSPKSNVIGSYSLRNKIGAKMGLKPIVAETAAKPKDRRLLSAKPKGKWVGKRIKRYPQPIYSIGQAALTAGDIAINNKLGIIIETAEYKAAMGPGSHEWGTDIGRDYFKKLTPGQDNPPEDPIKPLSIKARKPQDEKGVKITEGDGINVCPKEPIDLSSIVAKQAEYTKEKYPEDNEVNARWQANLDGILTGAYEGGKITWADVEALDKEAENITFDQEVKMGLYDPEELEANDFDDEPWNDTEILEVLSVQGRMKRRFAARRNRQRLTVARGIAMRRGSTPERLKRRATRGARLMVYKRLLRGRDRSTLPPAEKSRLETMIKRFQPLVNRIAVKLAPQMRRNELKRLSNRGKSAATVGKKFKAAKPIRGAASQKAKRYKIKKPGKYKQPKPKQYRMRGASGGPTIKRASKQYKAFSYSVG